MSFPTSFITPSHITILPDCSSPRVLSRFTTSDQQSDDIMGHRDKDKRKQQLAKMEGLARNRSQFDRSGLDQQARAALLAMFQQPQSTAPHVVPRPVIPVVSASSQSTAIAHLVKDSLQLRRRQAPLPSTELPLCREPRIREKQRSRRRRSLLWETLGIWHASGDSLPHQTPDRFLLASFAFLDVPTTSGAERCLSIITSIIAALSSVGSEARAT